MQGLFKIYHDPNFAAADIQPENTVLVPGTDGRAYRDKCQYGGLDQLSEQAGLIQTGDATLREAVDAFRQNRPPRWKGDVNKF
jgi:hypothetical protein